MPHDVFVSHSFRDKRTADAVCALLEADGVRCWIKPTDSWQRVVGIARALRSLGRVPQAAAAFARYGDMFAETEPSAARYSRTAQQFTMQSRSLGHAGGVYIYSIVEGGAGAAAGLAVGDIIVTYGGHPVPGMPEFLSARWRAPDGARIHVEILRMDDAGVFALQHVELVNGPLGTALMPI